jgi:hypothetical protein
MDFRCNDMSAKNWFNFLQKKQPPRRVTSYRRPGSKAQSLVELALFFPILLILLSGVVEFGILLNQFLNLLDGPREAARFAVDFTPFTGGGTVDNPDFYRAVAGEALNGIRPILLDSSLDDVVISVLGIDGVAITRFPTSGHLAGESALDTTTGEWHLFGQGGGCNPALVLSCHPTRYTGAQVAARVAQTGGGALPNKMGAILVEIFYNYPQTLKLPWLEIIPDPIPVYTYTIMPLPAAEPN